MHDHTSGAGIDPDIIIALPFVVALAFYGGCAVVQRRQGRAWPWYRSIAWLAGIIAAGAGFVGPLAAAAHQDFVAHMWVHLLVGMAAPLLLVLGAPVTLALRSMDVGAARRLSRLLNSWPARFVTAPIVAAVLNIGGMWALYSTSLYAAMQESLLVHMVVMTHFLLAGYLFTAAIIPIDPAPHRAGFPLRMGIVILALAAHGILAKTLYAHPPAGVEVMDAHAGAMLMYYAGDLIDVAIITILCAQWYRESGRNLRRRHGAPRSITSADRPLDDSPAEEHA
nr:cytochrome c oxidase assembly protein [Microbacterium hydrocarbonoxydans]